MGSTMPFTHLLDDGTRWWCLRCNKSQGTQGEQEAPAHDCTISDARLAALAATMTGDWDPGDIFAIVTARDVHLLVEEVRGRRAAESGA